jgi:hypothetical protein
MVPSRVTSSTRIVWTVTAGPPRRRVAVPAVLDAGAGVEARRGLVPAPMGGRRACRARLVSRGAGARPQPSRSPQRRSPTRRLQTVAMIYVPVLLEELTEAADGVRSWLAVALDGAVADAVGG